MEELKYQCCLCGEGIGESMENFHRLDPCAIVLIANWQAPQPQQAEQQFFCHLACFKKTVGQHAPVEIESLVPPAD